MVGALAAVPVLANASIPSGQSFGSWQVTSISSLSGVENDDPFATLVQDREAGQLSANWDGQRLEISASIDNCVADDSFDQSYEIPNDRLRGISRAQFVSRLTADFSTWIAQAKIACENGKQIEAFDLRRLDAAASNFIDRIR